MEPHPALSGPAPWVVLAIVIILALIGALAAIGSAIWAAQDAGKRGKSAALVAILVLLTWPVGLIVWLCVRPGPPAQS